LNIRNTLDDPFGHEGDADMKRANSASERPATISLADEEQVKEVFHV
jgi:hypothetical protein